MQANQETFTLGAGQSIIYGADEHYQRQVQFRVLNLFALP
jgi:hypothetical protein